MKLEGCTHCPILLPNLVMGEVVMGMDKSSSSVWWGGEKYKYSLFLTLRAQGASPVYLQCKSYVAQPHCFYSFYSSWHLIILIIYLFPVFIPKGYPRWMQNQPVQN